MADKDQDSKDDIENVEAEVAPEAVEDGPPEVEAEIVDDGHEASVSADAPVDEESAALSDDAPSRWRRSDRRR